MKVTFDGRTLIIEGMKTEDFIFRNFGGVEKKDKTGKRVFNSQGTRNFNIIVRDDNIEPFQRAGANIKEWIPSTAEEGDEPLHFVKVNCNTNSRRPPLIVVRKKNGKVEELPVGSYARLDSSIISNADLAINVWNGGYDHSSLYLASADFTLYSDPIREKIEDAFDNNQINPNGPDVQDEEVPFA